MASNNDPLHGQQILPFYLVGDTGSAPVVRGRLASVGRAATSILDRHGYPLAVASLQAEALAIAACLSTFMKFDGGCSHCRPKVMAWLKPCLPI